MAKMVTCVCAWRNCRAQFQARKADVARGWGKFCSKACKAKEQESRTGQNRAYIERGGVSTRERMSKFDIEQAEHEAVLDSMSDWEYGASDGGTNC